MKKVFLYFRFSVFGNFTALQSHISEIAKRIPKDFSRNLQSVQTSSGLENVYIFANSSASIAFSSRRIDFNFPSEKTDMTDLQTYLDYFDLQSIAIKRIAINYVESVLDEDGKIKTKLVNHIGFLTHTESEPKDILIQENGIFELNHIKFNDLVNVESTVLQNKDDFTQVPGIGVSLDLNSILEEDVSFPLDSLKDYFSSLRERAIEQMNKIIDFCNYEKKENS